MSYTPTTDFLALLRQVGTEVEFARMPGLDYVLAAMARAGLFTLSVGQNEPTVNQASTVWLRPAQPSWTAEGGAFLWNASTEAYELATPLSWAALLSGSPYLFQSAPSPSNIVGDSVSLVAVERTVPGATSLMLPTVLSRFGKPLQVVDWSTGVVSHAISLLPSGGATIMRRSSWTLLSTPDQLAGVTLHPSTDLNGWVIAP
jgi:hypothetical protein